MIEDFLASYPGRGVVHYLDAEGQSGWIYFLTGRSQSSRRRRVRFDADLLFVESVDPDMPTDVLRHYVCARGIGDDIMVVGNGDHVDVLAAGLRAASPLEEVVDSVFPEPDPPIHTPRIAFVLAPGGARMVAVRRRSAGSDEVERRVQRIGAQRSRATLLTTYSGTTEDPTGSAPFAISDERRSLEELGRGIWDALAPDIRVALVAGRGLRTRAGR